MPFSGASIRTSPEAWGTTGFASASGYTEFDGREQHAVHPVVATHPATGRRLLFVNRLMTRQVMELEPDVYQPILDRIFDLVDSGEFTYVHHWTPGDLLLWDNRCTQHARQNFDPEERRVMRRFSVVGDNGPTLVVKEKARI